MKIIRIKEFRHMPEHTVFIAAETPWAWGEISFLGEVYPDYNDWTAAQFDCPESDGSEQLFERLDDMLTNGASYPLETEGYSRHGLYPKDPIFMVYEKADLLKLRDQIDKAIAACG